MTNGPEKLSFYICELVAGDQPQVIGRCGDLAIQRGDIFATLCRYGPRERLEEFSRPPELLASEPISLRVLEIRAYDQPLDELGAGMTGSLVLDGDGHQSIGPGTILEAKARAMVA